MTAATRIECTIHIGRGAKGCRQLETVKPSIAPLPAGRVPRIARLLALARKFDALVGSGQVSGYASLVRVGHVSRARISQIMNLLQLAPDIQEQILFLPLTVRRRDPIRLQQLQPIAKVLEWHRQRELWRDLLQMTYEMPVPSVAAASLEKRKKRPTRRSGWDGLPHDSTKHRGVPVCATTNPNTVASTGKDDDGAKVTDAALVS